MIEKYLKTEGPCIQKEFEDEFLQYFLCTLLYNHKSYLLGRISLWSWPHLLSMSVFLAVTAAQKAHLSLRLFVRSYVAKVSFQRT